MFGHASISNEELYDMMSYFSSIESLGIGHKTCHTTENEQKALDLITTFGWIDRNSVDLESKWNGNSENTK